MPIIPILAGIGLFGAGVLTGAKTSDLIKGAAVLTVGYFLIQKVAK